MTMMSKKEMQMIAVMEMMHKKRVQYVVVLNYISGELLYAFNYAYAFSLCLYWTILIHIA
jgi:hypothetical protein